MITLLIYRQYCDIIYMGSITTADGCLCADFRRASMEGGFLMENSTKERNGYVCHIYGSDTDRHLSSYLDRISPQDKINIKTTVPLTS